MYLYRNKRIDINYIRVLLVLTVTSLLTGCWEIVTLPFYVSCTEANWQCLIIFPIKLMCPSQRLGSFGNVQMYCSGSDESFCLLETSKHTHTYIHTHHIICNSRYRKSTHSKCSSLKRGNYGNHSSHWSMPLTEAYLTGIVKNSAVENVP